jgi:hypothetical protein
MTAEGCLYSTPLNLLSCCFLCSGYNGYKRTKTEEEMQYYGRVRLLAPIENNSFRHIAARTSQRSCPTARFWASSSLVSTAGNGSMIPAHTPAATVLQEFMSDKFKYKPRDTNQPAPVPEAPKPADPRERTPPSPVAEPPKAGDDEKRRQREVEQEKRKRQEEEAERRREADRQEKEREETRQREQREQRQHPEQQKQEQQQQQPPQQQPRTPEPEKPVQEFNRFGADGYDTAGYDRCALLP